MAEVSGYTQVLASAARTTTQTSPDITIPFAAQIDVILDATVNAGGAGSITLTINAKDPVSGKYYLLLAGAAVVTVSTNVYKIGRSLPVTTNVSANSGIPNVLQFVVTANNANPVTYSVGMNTMPI
jgi:hypothetical protein